MISCTFGWYCSTAFNAHARPQPDPQFLEDQHEVVKPGHIVKAKVIDDDLKHQRIALMMRMEDAASCPSAQAQAGSQAARAPQPIGAMALALAKASKSHRYRHPPAFLNWLSHNQLLCSVTVRCCYPQSTCLSVVTSGFVRFRLFPLRFLLLGQNILRQNEGLVQ